MGKILNTLSANPTKWSNTLKQFVGNLPTNCLSVFDHLMNLALKGLKKDFISLFLSPCLCVTEIIVYDPFWNFRDPNH